MRFRSALLAVGLGAAMAGAAQAQTVDLSNQAMFGIHRTNGNLLKYTFGTQQLVTVGAVTNSQTNASIVGIDAAAYFPGNSNIYGFWQSSSDNKNKLLYIDVTNAKATVMNNDVEGGKFTGATGAATASNPFAVFAIQAAKIKPPSAITGLVNINPNNSAANEFSLTKGTGGTITRDDLKTGGNDGVTVAPDGTFYQGAATLVHVKPKGNGNQNSLLLDGVAYPLQNANTYDFSGDMQVRLYNDQVNGNFKAMGHWWLQVVSGQVIVNNAVQVLSPNRLTSINQVNGTVTELKTLSQTYSGLATTDGTVFYTTLGKDLYKLDTVAQSETKIGSTSLTNIIGMAIVNGSLVVYDATQTVIVPLNTSTGANAGSTSNPGMGPIGPIMFTPPASIPSAPLFD